MSLCSSGGVRSWAGLQYKERSCALSFLLQSLSLNVPLLVVKIYYSRVSLLYLSKSSCSLLGILTASVVFLKMKRAKSQSSIILSYSVEMPCPWSSRTRAYCCLSYSGICGKITIMWLIEKLGVLSQAKIQEKR